ncbi:MAG: hypothetical protein ABIY55_06550 [Kofleriaceae bacterium]
MSIHPESLLNIPLVRQAFEDLAFRFVPRNTDASWSYEGTVPISLGGFNPFELSFYYGHTSRFAAWLSDPFGSARELNENDQLLREVLFMVHDYLHAWAYTVIDELCPSLRVFHGAIDAQSFDDYVFCHLLTEAVATTGLDYWFLCTCDLNAICPIGTNMKSLTVDYHQSRLPEYHRFSPDLEVQTPAFFRALTAFYCSGEFPGFDVDDIRRSPQLLRWLRHELSYGAIQRDLSRDWLAYIAGAPLATAPSDVGIDIDTPVRARLIDGMAERLWAKVKHGDASNSAIRPPATPPRRTAPVDQPPDFRFVNLARVPIEQWSSMQPATEKNFNYFVYQYLGQLSRSTVPDGKLKHLRVVLQQRDVSLLLDLFDGLRPHSAFDDEPRDLMIAN